MRIPEECHDYGVYRDLLSSSLRQNLIYQEDLRRLREMVGGLPSKDLSILSIGPATGVLEERLCRSFPRKNFDFTLVEPEQGLALEAQERLESAGAIVTGVINHSIEKYLPLPSSYGLVLCTRVVHHLGCPETVLSHLYDALAPQGHLYVSDLLRPKSEKEVRFSLRLRQAVLEHALSLEMAESSLRAALTLEEVERLVGVVPGKLELSENWFKNWHFHSYRD